MSLLFDFMISDLLYLKYWINSWWPNDAIWQHIFGSTLAQVMSAVRQQAITWTNVDLPSVRSIGIHFSTILQEILQPSIIKISWKMTFLKFLLNLPGANELSHFWDWLLATNHNPSPMLTQARMYSDLQGKIYSPWLINMCTHMSS